MTDVETIYRNRWTDPELAEMRAVWRVIVADFLQRFVDEDAVVLDVGAGFCHFINNVKAAERIAVDANPNIRAHADPGVRVVVTSDLSLKEIPDASVTHVFMSNFLEHLKTSDDVLDLLRTVRRKLRPGGSVIVLQPNYRFTGAAYFDFIDHHVVLTDRSLVEALEVTGFTMHYLAKRFLPYTSKSRLPKAAALVRMYLKVPLLWRVFGQQTLAVARKPTNGTTAARG